MRSLIKRNYKSIVQRGLINHATTLEDFINKLKEEVNEFEHHNSPDNFNEELSDVILVCLNIAEHYQIDIEKEMIKKIKINEKRQKFLP
jgi:NTP pyrophosphatase (non-canonical NTP hydrolase)